MIIIRIMNYMERIKKVISIYQDIIIMKDMRSMWIYLLILMLAGCSVAFLPDTQLNSMSGKIYFDSNRNGNYEIYIMNADGSNIINITNTPDYDEVMPAVSPDGHTVVFMKAKHYDFASNELWAADADGSNVRQLTHNSSADGHADFAPDSRHIVYVSWRDGNEELYIMNIENGEDRRITFNNASDNDPDWSPDGAYISFKSTRAYTDSSEADFLDIRYEIFEMDTAGNNAVQLTNDSLSDHDPDYSPDGNDIAFLRVFEDNTNDVCIMERNGNNIKNLSVTGDNWYTSFSPDGQYIAFCSTRDESADIYIMGRDGSNPVRVTFGIFTDEFPAWR